MVEDRWQRKNMSSGVLEMRKGKTEEIDEVGEPAR